jgi:hypothetical protein
VSIFALWLLRIWIVLYLIALALFMAGTVGLFGSEPTPLAGVFLVPMGQPWTAFVDIFPEPLWPWLAAAAPLVNISLLYGIHRAFGRDGSGRRR